MVNRPFWHAFIVTKKNVDRTISYQKYSSVKAMYTRKLPVVADSIGCIALKVDGARNSYTLQNDDLYVRAAVISDRKNRLGDEQKAFSLTQRVWTQPFTPAR